MEAVESRGTLATSLPPHGGKLCHDPNEANQTPRRQSARLSLLPPLNLIPTPFSSHVGLSCFDTVLGKVRLSLVDGRVHCLKGDACQSVVNQWLKIAGDTITESGESEREVENELRW